MPPHLYLAPAGHGKTACVLGLVRAAAQGLATTPRVVVPTPLQAHAWRRRLAAAGGAFGVRLLTFDRLYAEILNAEGLAYTELSEEVQYRLLRAVIDSLPLRHYAPLVPRPGFAQVLERLIGELKAARVHPDTFAAAVESLGAGPRLVELGQVYSAYQARLRAQGWADRPGLGWLAAEALEVCDGRVARDWPLLVVDGFDNFSAVQLAVLQALAGRVGEMIVALTGDAEGLPRPLVHRRFWRTRERVEEALAVAAEPLPRMANNSARALAHLEAGLFRSQALRIEAGGAVDLVEAPDRAAEARAALRWLKARIVLDGMSPGEVALLARDVRPYRPFIQQTAAEFGLPVRLIDGLPLHGNPAVAAVLDLLRLMLPLGSQDTGPALPRRGVVEAWRSPYCDWSAAGIGPGDAGLLDAAARRGRVIAGLDQWREALERLVTAQAQPSLQEADEESEAGPLPALQGAQTLRGKFERFVDRLTPPPGARSVRDWVRWLEDLMGPDPDPGDASGEDAQGSLRLVACARAAAGTAERDVAALRALKDVLRGLLWAEEALGGGQLVDYAKFLDDLAGAVEAATFQLPSRPGREEIAVANVIQARGVPFRAVAVLGLAEGEFPAALGEDPFLRDADRERLRREFGLPLEASTESAEPEFFYEAVTRPWQRLLLTRPRLADNGAPWQASPFWEEVRRLVEVNPQALTAEAIVPAAEAASWPELMEGMAAYPGDRALQEWVQQQASGRLAGLHAAAGLFRVRRGGPSAPHEAAFDGDLGSLADELGRRFGPAHDWSASRLETYRSCPFSFLVGRVLGLQPRQDPAEGLDPAQLGTVYHRILEQVYQAESVGDPGDLSQLLAALPAVAAQVLDAAPAEMGFRETAWWAHTRDEIVANVGRCLEALNGLPGGFVPLAYEADFGLGGGPVLVVEGQEGDRFRLHGVIDRVDRAPDGRLRLIDYKSGGPWPFTPKAVAEGKKLQLPLYALAARDALGLGEPADGFYWHVRQAQASSFSLAHFEGGPPGAIDAAVEWAWQAVHGARGGRFVPHPPGDGCPPYCPAIGFCWQVRLGFGG